MEKNEIVTVEIVDMSSEGEGIGKVDGFPLFIKDAVIGDVAEVKVIKWKKSYGYGRLMEIVKPSPDRVEPRCPIARSCGGCQLQSLRYEKQLEFKQKKVWNNLKRIGGLNVVMVQEGDVSEAAAAIPVYPTIGMENPWRYRNKAQLPVGYDRDGNLVAGFYAGRTHCIIAQEDCFIANERNKEILDCVLSFMKKYHIEPYQEEAHRGLVRHILIRVGYHTGEVMVCLVINGKSVPHSQELVEALRCLSGMTSISLNVNQERTNVILGTEIINLYGEGYITDRIGDVSFQISPLSFFQVNPVQTEKLYRKALEYADLGGNETVWDLYCGIGTISLFLAQKAKIVRGVEIIPAAIEDARRNARLNGFTNTEFYVGKAEEVLPAVYEKEKCCADVIVVDPPRKGCDEVLLETIVRMQPKRVVYVSCDSATLARDLKWLGAHGYEMRCAQPVDMFPETGHVETVCLLSNTQRKKESYITLDVEMADYYRIKNEGKTTGK